MWGDEWKLISLTGLKTNLICLFLRKTLSGISVSVSNCWKSYSWLLWIRRPSRWLEMPCEPPIQPLEEMDLHWMWLRCIRPDPYPGWFQCSSCRALCVTLVLCFKWDKNQSVESGNNFYVCDCREQFCVTDCPPAGRSRKRYWTYEKHRPRNNPIDLCYIFSLMYLHCLKKRFQSPIFDFIETKHTVHIPSVSMKPCWYMLLLVNSGWSWQSTSTTLLSGVSPRDCILTVAVRLGLAMFLGRLHRCMMRVPPTGCNLLAFLIKKWQSTVTTLH